MRCGPSSRACDSPDVSSQHRIVDPTGDLVVPRRTLAAGMGPLDEASIALISNGRHNVDVFVQQLARRLSVVTARVDVFETGHPTVGPAVLAERLQHEHRGVVIAMAEGGNPTHLAVDGALAFEARGIPCVIVAASAYAEAARGVAAARGAEQLRLVTIDGALASLNATQVEELADRSGAAVAAALVGETGTNSGRLPPRAPAGTADMDEASFDAAAQSRGWSDGLPLIAPTQERVAAMLAAAPALTDDAIGPVAPHGRLATLDAVAANAVMAGCRPGWFPFVIAALRACLDPVFNLEGIQTTAHNVSTLIVVSGAPPALGYSSGANCLGPGNAANATTGRALRLCLRNIGGAGVACADGATLGSPAKFAYCMAESGAAPWATLSSDRGFNADEPVVTVFAGEAPHNVSDHVSSHPEGILFTMSSAVRTLASNNAYMAGEILLIICPEHAGVIASAGWDKDDVRRYVFEHARNPLRDLKRGGLWGMHHWPDSFAAFEDDDEVPMVERPDDIAIAVAGGPGRHSACVHSWGATRSASRRVIGD